MTCRWEHRLRRADSYRRGLVRTPRSLARVAAGTNLARQEAYGKLLARGFRTDIQGVTNARRAGVYVIDDWR